MPLVKAEEAENEGIMEVSRLMLVSARTAPKSGGIDDIVMSLVFGEEKETLAAEMDKLANERKISQFSRDARNVKESQAVILIGVRVKKFGLNCGACGYPNCDEFEKAGRKKGQDFTGPTCLFKALDLGIALGSAVKTASILNVDNRIMYRVGTAAERLGLMPEADIIMGLPVSAKGKSIYFDRKWPP
nr:DUF2148 domain-containing protein [Candidatus Njordarchaeota archaeon]